MCVLFAREYPARVTSLVLSERMGRTTDGARLPVGVISRCACVSPPRSFISAVLGPVARGMWGACFAPSFASEPRASTSPPDGALCGEPELVQKIFEISSNIDAGAAILADSSSIPTLVLSPAGDPQSSPARGPAMPSRFRARDTSSSRIAIIFRGPATPMRFYQDRGVPTGSPRRSSPTACWHR